MVCPPKKQVSWTLDGTDVDAACPDDGGQTAQMWTFRVSAMVVYRP